MVNSEFLVVNSDTNFSKMKDLSRQKVKLEIAESAMIEAMMVVRWSWQEFLKKPFTLTV